MTHFLTALDVLVEELHHLAGIETVGLAQVDEQPAVAGLGLAAAARTTALLLAARTTFLALGTTLFLLRGRFLDLWCIGIVSQELTELDRHNLLDDIFFVDILEVTADVLHERGNLLFLDIGLQDLVHHLVELFLTDFGSCRDVALDKLLAYLFLDGAYLVLLTSVHNRDAGAFLAGTASTARAVGVVLDIVGQSVVDDMRQVVDVQSAGSHVGSHQQLRQVTAELLHGQVALLLREVAVQGLGIIAVLDELVGYLLRLNLRAAEDNGKDTGIEVDNALQCQVFVLGIHHVIHMVDILGTLVAAAHHNLLVVVQVVEGYLLDFLAHGGREEQGVTVFGHMLENLVDALRETHVEHLVGLVEHHVGCLIDLRLATVHQVDETTRCGHDDMGTVAQSLDLLHNVGTTVDGYHANAGHVFREITKIVGNLQTKFAGGTQDQGLSGRIFRVDTL